MISDLTLKREAKPRNIGITMVMDKGLGLYGVKDLVEINAKFIDFIKLGFGTSLITHNLEDKVKIYTDAGITVYFGGTLFEFFYKKKKLDLYFTFLDKYKIDTIEISDGSIELNHDEKCEIIRNAAKNFRVLSEVGSKEEGYLISPSKWVNMMKKEKDAGAFKVIAEARESGNVGIFRPNKSVHTQLINIISRNINQEDIIWEAPKKTQQVWFIKKFGNEVNLGNISPNDTLGLECLRLGLRGDTLIDNINL